MTVLVWVGVGVLGGFGAVLRFVVDGAVATKLGKSFPFGTFAVNISGAVVLGFVAGLALHHDQNLLAGTAVIGSYTTFSTWMFETQRLSEERQLPTAAVNIVVSVVLGVLVAAAGQWIGVRL